MSFKPTAPLPQVKPRPESSAQECANARANRRRRLAVVLDSEAGVDLGPEVRHLLLPLRRSLGRLNAVDGGYGGMGGGLLLMEKKVT